MKIHGVDCYTDNLCLYIGNGIYVKPPGVSDEMLLAITKRIADGMVEVAQARGKAKLLETISLIIDKG